jgi:hypothetical protein
METIELKVNRTVTEVKSIALPVYRIDNCHAYMVPSKDKCIQVNHGGLRPAIEACHAELAWHGKETTDCTESEFKQKYQEVRQRLDLIVCPPEVRHKDLTDQEGEIRASEIADEQHLNQV